MSTPNGHFGFGQPATTEQIAGWDIDVAADGTGLPPGSGTVAQGKELYDRLGATCHGAKGEGGEGGPPLVGGIGSLNTDAPLKTVGSYWPHAPVLYDYIHRAMPLNSPGSLRPNETYSLVAYLLVENEIIDTSTVIDARSLPRIRMPARGRFVVDDRVGGPVFR